MDNDKLKFNTIPRQGTFGKVVDTTNKNFELAKVAIDGLEYATHRNKGLFGTLNSLIAKYPTPNYGDWALVGSSFPCQVYRCDADNHTWVAAGTYQGDNISLNDYVTKAQHNADTETIEGEIEDLREAIYGVSVEQELTFNDRGSAQALEITIPLGSKIFLSGDLSEVVGMTNVSDNTDYQTITSGTVTDRNISYIKNGSEIGSVTITAIVENGLKRDVEAIKYDYTDFENKLRGVGQNANGSLYPMFNLGDFANINEVNAAVDSAFATQGNTIKQGRLKLRRNGQIIFVDQFAIDFSQGRWAQMAYGMVAPSSQDDGLTLIQATDHPHIVWRMNGVDNGKWRDLEGNISLKTINGNSLYGEGDLTISEAAQIVVDTALDSSSGNAIANSAVATVVAEIYSTFAEAVQQVMEEKGTIICKVWQGNTNWPSAITTPIGTYGFDTTNKELLRVNDLQSWAHIDLSEEIVYVDAVNNKQYRWNGTDMVSIGGGNNGSVVDHIVHGNYNPVTSNAVAVAMSQFCIDEVAVIKCWSDDSQDYDNWEMGDYWYDPEEDELWRCNDQQGTDFEEVLRPIIMLKEPDYDVWIWNTQTAKKFDVETETSISEETAESTNPPTTKAVYQALQSIEVPIEEEEDEKLYPEYYANGNQADGINYYEWPFRCFRMPDNGEEITISNDTYNLCVWAPDQLIAVPNAQNSEHSYIPEVNGVTQPTSEDVVYYETGHCFLLKVGTSYYKKWGLPNDNSIPEGSSRDWQSDSGEIRTDTVFSDITITSVGRDVQTNKLLYTQRDRTSYIMKNGVLTDIESTMTDFTQPILDCLRANNGSMRLHKGKIYFMHNFTQSANGYSFGNNTNPFYSAKNFIVDGNGGVLFVSKRTKGRCYVISGGADDTTDSVFTLYNSYNGEFRNLKIMAMLNRDCGAPGSHYRLSSSCSGLKAFALYWDTIHSTTVRESNIRFKNIKTQWMYEDFNMKGGVGVSIEGFSSYGACQNAYHYALNLKVRDSHWIQHPYGGDGMHLIYAQTLSKNMHFENCSFVQTTEYNSVMITAHGGTEDWKKPKWMFFTNCYFEGGQIICETSNGWVFDGCTFHQTLQHHIGNYHAYATPSSILYDATPSIVDITMKNCHIVLNGLKLYYGGAARKYARMLLDNCYIVNIAGSTNGNLVSKAGMHVYSRNTFIHNWPYASLGFTGSWEQSEDPNAIRITTAYADFDFVSRWRMLKVDRILHGVTPLRNWMKVNYTWASFFEEDVEREYNLLWRNNPTLGEIRTDEDALISYKCTNIGIQGATRIYLASFNAGTESSKDADDNGVISSKTVTLKLSDIETVAVTVNGTFKTSDALYAELKTLFEAKGYTVVDASNIDSSYDGLVIYQKIRFDNSTASVSQTIPKTYDSDNQQNVYCTISTSTVLSVDGENPTWQVKSEGMAEELATFSESMSEIRQTLYGDVSDFIEVSDVESLPNDVDAGQLAKVGDDFYICTAEGTRAVLPVLVGTPSDTFRGTIKLFLNPDDISESVDVTINEDNQTSFDVRSKMSNAVVASGLASTTVFTDKNYILIKLKQRGKVLYTSDYVFGSQKNGQYRFGTNDKIVTFGTISSLKLSAGGSWGRFSSGSNATWEPYDADTGIVGEVQQNKEDLAELKTKGGFINSVQVMGTSPSAQNVWNKGDLWYDTGNSKLKAYNGNTFDDVAEPCIFFYIADTSTPLYLWTGTQLRSITVGSVIS